MEVRVWDTAIGGVLVIAGGMFGLAGNYLIEKRRWKREDRIRFQADKLGLYRDLLNDVRFAFDLRYCDDQMSLDLNSLVSEIDLLSTNHVSKTAEKLVLATEHWCETGFGWFRGDDDEVEARKLAFEEAKASFQKAGRVEIGIPEESVGS